MITGIEANKRATRSGPAVGGSPIALAFLVLACGGEPQSGGRAPTGPEPPVAPVAEISISPSAAALFTGTAVELKATPLDASGRTVSASFSWNTSDASVATVTSTPAGAARVEGIGVGEATISVTAQGVTASAPARVYPSLSVENDRASTGHGRLLQEEEPHLVMGDGGRLFGAWQDFGIPCCVLFSNSSDEGASWAAEVPMPPHRQNLPPGRTLAQKDPWLTLDGQGTLYFSWLEEIVHLEGNQELVLDTSLVLVARSDNGGGTWSRPVNAQSVQPGKADKPSIASDETGGLYVGYSLFGADLQFGGPDESVVVTRSVDGGETWSAPVELDTGHILITNIAAGSAGQVCAGWRDISSGAAKVGCSADQGVSWETTTLGALNDSEEANYFDFGPTVAVGPDGAFVAAWIDPEFRLVVAWSQDAGLTWSEPTVVDGEPQSRRWQPTLAVGADSRIHATWYDDRMGAIHVVYSTSSDGGETWSPGARVTSEATPFGRSGPDATRLGDYMGLAAVPDGSAHVLWTDWRSSSQDVFHAHIHWEGQ